MGRKLSEAQIEEIVRAYKSGSSSPLLAKRFYVSTVTISRWLRVKKVVTRTGAPPRLASYDALCADYISGLTQAQVAEKHHVSVPTVCGVKLQGVRGFAVPRKGFRAQDKYYFLGNVVFIRFVNATLSLGVILSSWMSRLASFLTQRGSLRISAAPIPRKVIAFSATSRSDDFQSARWPMSR